MTFVISAPVYYFLSFLFEEINLLICSLPVLLALGLDHHRQDFSFLQWVSRFRWGQCSDDDHVTCSFFSAAVKALPWALSNSNTLQERCSSLSLSTLRDYLGWAQKFVIRKKKKSHLQRTSVEKCNLWNRTEKRAPSEGLALFCRMIERRTTKHRRWKSIGNRSSRNKINLLKPTQQEAGVMKYESMCQKCSSLPSWEYQLMFSRGQKALK